MDDFVIWAERYQEGSCVIQNPEGFGDQFLLMEGVELLNQWPENVFCRMDAEFPKDIHLSDNLYGGDYPVISRRLKDQVSVLTGVSQIEFLPVSILNHKGRVASKDYFILNPLGAVDCIDIEKSGVVWSAINASHISRVKQLVLKNSAIPADVGMVRPAYLTETILLRRSVSDRLSNDGFTGLSFREPTKFRG
jgi:hypothetical protein